jgi:hypothetical protein
MRKLMKAGVLAHRIEVLVAAAIPILGVVVCVVVWLF